MIQLIYFIDNIAKMTISVYSYPYSKCWGVGGRVAQVSIIKQHIKII